MSPVTVDRLKKRPRDPGAAVVAFGTQPAHSKASVFRPREVTDPPEALTNERRLPRDPGAAVFAYGTQPARSKRTIFTDEDAQ